MGVTPEEKELFLDFQRQWTLDRVRKMSLEEYSQIGSKDTFTYWIEHRLDTLGRIRGGSSFKFGIYHRKDKKEQQDTREKIYTDDYAWTEKLGNTKEKAFEKVKQNLIKIIEASQNNQLEIIENINELGHVFKWKIAFHYQNISDIRIVCIFDQGTLKEIAKKELGNANLKTYEIYKELLKDKKYNLEEMCMEKSIPLWDKYGKNAEKTTQSEKTSQEQNTKNSIPLNQILYGPPGTGKTYSTIDRALEILGYKKEYREDRNEAKKLFNDFKEKGQIAFITFHQSYSYEEFVEGIKPELNALSNDKSGQISYKIKNGIFKELCKKAENDKEHPYILIIDEINRGNISKILGELITLIEEDKRMGAKEEIKLKLPYSQEEFGVPKNLYIIGTMNTADRSIAFMDTASRRRFEFIEMMPEPEKLKKIWLMNEIGKPNRSIDNYNSKEASILYNILKAINERIEFLLDREHLIGHAFFFEKAEYCHDKDKNIAWYELSLENLKELFTRKIIPLLQEYFYEDYAKIKAVLNDNGMIEEKSQDFLTSEIKELGDGDKTIYKIASFDDEIWKNDKKYQKIYDMKDANEENKS